MPQLHSPESNDSDMQMKQISEHTKEIFIEHNYALNMKIKGEDEFECSVCGYITDIRTRFRRHKAEHCDKKPNLSEACPICDKVYTHNGLRDHLRNYTVQNRAFRGVHKKFTVKYHKNLLAQISRTKRSTLSN